MKYNNAGFTLIETLISCLLGALLVISLSSLQIKNTQLLSNSYLQNFLQQKVADLRELSLAAPTSLLLTPDNLIASLDLKTAWQNENIQINYLSSQRWEIKTSWQTIGETSTDSKINFSLIFQK